MIRSSSLRTIKGKVKDDSQMKKFSRILQSKFKTQEQKIKVAEERKQNGKKNSDLIPILKF